MGVVGITYLCIIWVNHNITHLCAPTHPGWYTVQFRGSEQLCIILFTILLQKDFRNNVLWIFLSERKEKLLKFTFYKQVSCEKQSAVAHSRLTVTFFPFFTKSSDKTDWECCPCTGNWQKPLLDLIFLSPQTQVNMCSSHLLWVEKSFLIIFTVCNTLAGQFSLAKVAHCT